MDTEHDARHVEPVMLLLSAPGTGYNFVFQFMKGPTHFRGWHTEPSIMDMINLGEKTIIPLRHPYLAYRTQRQRSKHGEVLMYWQYLVDITKELRDVFYVPIDAPKEKRLDLLRRLAVFIGRDNDDDFVQSYAERWEPLNASHPKAKLVAVPDMKFAVEWYRWRRSTAL